MRLTGDPVIRDEEFSMVFSGAISENILSLLSVAALLWLGLRTMRLILPMLLVLILGLVVTAAFGALFIGPYNPLSIAFAVMFIGLAVDFAIQYSVCLREQRHRLRSEPLSSALVTAAAIAGPGIGLAALALCAGFLAFLPTDYRGLSELGIIASAGMMIGVIASLTTLPALLILSRPQDEQQPVGYAALAPLDRFLTRRARGVAVVTGVLALAAAACLPFLHFDSNPLNLRNPTTEAVSTFRDLMSDPETTPNTIQSLVPGLVPRRLWQRAWMPCRGVRHADAIDFVPKDQTAKLALIHDTAELLGPTLEPPVTEPPPKDADTTRAFAAASAALLHAAAGEQADPLLVAPASRLGIALRVLAEGPPAALDRLHSALIPGLVTTLDVLRTMLDARQIILADLPDLLRRDWIAPTGLARVEVRPRDLSDHYDAMARFSQAVLAVAPGASGLAVIVQGGAHTIGDAFLRAGVIATALTLILLLAALRSWRLAVLALAPLALAGLLTLATCVAMGLRSTLPTSSLYRCSSLKVWPLTSTTSRPGGAGCGHCCPPL